MFVCIPMIAFRASRPFDDKHQYIAGVTRVTMFVASIGRAGQRIIDAIVRWLAHGHINPNVLTLVGVSINVGSGLLFGFGKFFWAGVVLIVANLFDMLDGQVARLSGRVTS